MALATNMQIETPLGPGVIDGRFMVLDGEGRLVTTGISVRLPVNEITKPHLHKSNCMTPAAVLSGVWVFPEKDLGHENQSTS